MAKPGVVTLPIKVFPELKDTYTEQEKKNMLILTGMDMNGSGLQVFQTTPELLVNNEAIANQDISKTLFPITANAMEKEFIHAKFICLLNNSSSGDNIDYVFTAVFIADDNKRNFKLADVYLGEPGKGSWATEEQVKRVADGLMIQQYTK